MNTPDTWADHAEWIRKLSVFLGCTLRLVEGSEIINHNGAAGTLKGTLGLSHPGVTVELIVELLTTLMDDGTVAVWALVFFYVDKRRVAVPGETYLTLEFKGGEWHRRPWEKDIYDEWTGHETFD